MCATLLLRHSNLGLAYTVSEIRRLIGRKLQFFLTSYHPLISAPLLRMFPLIRMFPLKVHAEVYLVESRVTEDHMIIAYVILAQYVSACDRWSDGFIIARTAFCMASYADAL